MFGKPEWFKEKTVGWGLFPVSWQGWIYAAVWTTILSGPFAALMVRGQFVEATVWIVAAIAGLSWDVYDIMRQKRKKSELQQLLYIGGEEGGDQASTDKFELKVKT